MKVIGITGGIATGKSTASAHLKSLGAMVWDADATAKTLTAPGGEAIRAIRRTFGEEYILPDGSMDRKKMADLVFADAKARQQLDGILHPIIIAHMRLQLQQWQQQGVPVAVVDVPLLFECGADAYVDEAWVLSCGMDEQLLRLHQRGLAPDEALARIAAQMSDSERRRRARRIIDTSQAPEETRRAITALYEELLDEL